MRWRHRTDWVFGLCSAAIVSLSYAGSYLVFESSDAYSSTGGRPPQPVEGVRAPQGLSSEIPVGLDAFFSFYASAHGAATAAPLDSVLIEVRDAAGELVPGTPRILDEHPGNAPQEAQLVIGWEADEPQEPGAVLTATIDLLSSDGAVSSKGTLSVSDETPELNEPDFEFRDWVHGVADVGTPIGCGADAHSTFGAELIPFAEATLVLPTPPTPVAVAWRYSLEPTPESGSVEFLPSRFFVLGPHYYLPPQEARPIFFADSSEYCIQVSASDLRTDLEYSVEVCGDHDLSTPAVNADSIIRCAFEDLPPGDAYRQRWCLAQPETSQPECQSILGREPDPPPPGAAGAAGADGPAGAAGSAGGPPMTATGDNAGKPPVADSNEDGRHTSQACALTTAPKPRAGNFAALWSLALLLAARARRRGSPTTRA